MREVQPGRKYKDCLRDQALNQSGWPCLQNSNGSTTYKRSYEKCDTEDKGPHEKNRLFV